jgi:hypothetical protein
MAEYVLLGGGGLTALQTGTGEVPLGSLYKDPDGNVHRFVKNKATTALVAAGVCLKAFTSVIGNIDKRVTTPDAATGPVTALVHVPAGSPITAIQESGSSTGDHGWIMVKGLKSVSMMQAATLTLQEVGCRTISTLVQPATQPWDKGVSKTISSSGGQVNLYGAVVAAQLITTGVATAASAIVYIDCLV